MAALSFVLQYRLADDPDFILRIRQAIITKALADIKTWSGGKATVKQENLLLANRIVNDPNTMAQLFAVGIATDSNINEHATDAELTTAIATYWPSYAGYPLSEEILRDAAWTFLQAGAQSMRKQK